MRIAIFNPQDDATLFRPVTNSDTVPQESVPVNVPVLIIGGGPAGLLQAYLLSQLGGQYIPLLW